MNKTDKFLYGGFAVVIVAGIVAMLVSVFSPPKQIVEEIVETPQIEVGTAKSIENVPNQMEQWRQDVENARRQREADEALAEQIKTNPELAKLVQAEEDAKRAQEEAERKEKEWWESRKEWIERFPFQPTPHTEITFDPSIYDPHHLKEWTEEWTEEETNAYDKMARMVSNHGFLKRFYESKLPYTEEFEQMYDIVKEELGEELHPIPLGWTFETLRKYHQAKHRDPDSVYRKNARVHSPIPKQEPTIININNLPLEEQATFQNMTKQEKLKFMMETAEEIRRENNPHFDNPVEVRDVTWGERVEDYKESILGSLRRPPMPREDDSRLMSMEMATKIRDRLLNEIPAAGFLEKGHKSLCYVQEYEDELKAGDPLLVR